MTSKLNTKIVAAIAVLAMMFAGFGLVFASNGDDAVPVADKDLIIEVNGAIILGAEESAEDFAPGVIMIKTTLKDDLAGLTVVEYDQYNTYIKPYVKGAFAVFPVDAYDVEDLAFQSILGRTMTTTDDSNAFAKVIVKTQVVFDMDLAAEVVIAAADVDTAKVEAKAIAAAFNAVPAGYISQEAADAAAAAAVAEKDAVIAEKDALIAEKDALIATKDAKVAELQAIIDADDSAAVIAQKNAEIAGLQTQIADKDKAIADKDKQIAELTEKIEKLDAPAKPLWETGIGQCMIIIVVFLVLLVIWFLYKNGTFSKLFKKKNEEGDEVQKI